MIDISLGTELSFLSGVSRRQVEDPTWRFMNLMGPSEEPQSAIRSPQSSVMCSGADLPCLPTAWLWGAQSKRLLSSQSAFILIYPCAKVV